MRLNHHESTVFTAWILLCNDWKPIKCLDAVSIREMSYLYSLCFRCVLLLSAKHSHWNVIYSTCWSFPSNQYCTLCLIQRGNTNVFVLTHKSLSSPTDEASALCVRRWYQTTVLSSFLFTVYSSDFSYNTTNCLQSFSEDTGFIGCGPEAKQSWA